MIDNLFNIFLYTFGTHSVNILIVGLLLVPLSFGLFYRLMFRG